jgi:TPP-dependent pyruvate/acetoin dehydrogenase alpha subunit
MIQRDENYNVLPDAIRRVDKDVHLNIFRKMCLVRSFEGHAVEAVEKRIIAYPVYLSSGQEAVAAALAQRIRTYQTFPQHRAHDIFLAFGAPPELLADELLGLPTGASGGRAGSNCLQYHHDGIDIYGHHGLIGENVPQAAGAALANNKPTLCVFGDGSAEEDYVLSSLGFAATHKLPVLFVCIDNGLSILTPTEKRRSWDLAAVAASFGLESVDCADDPSTLLLLLERLSARLPALLNVRVCRSYWHVGAGRDGTTEWDRYSIYKDSLRAIGLGDEVIDVERQTSIEMDTLWQTRLLQQP